MEVTDDGGLGAWLDMAPIAAAASPAIVKMIANIGGSESDSADPATCSHRWRNGECAVCKTPCTHESWTNGTCNTCSLVCTHVGTHDEDSLVCSVCSTVGYHTFVDSECACGATTIFEMDAIPDSYLAECDQKGTVESFVYDTYAYALEAVVDNGERLPVTKEAKVYLPYGYDPSKSYDVIYLLHGGGDPNGNAQNAWLVDHADTVNILDNMIKNGDCDPVIVVTPTFYSVVDGVQVDETATNWTTAFGYELMNDLIPAVESKYATYAEGNVSAENLKATRAHRAYAGLSMGSMTSFNSILSYCTDYIGYVGSYSAGPEADIALALAAAEKIAASLNASSNEIYYWFNANGVKDMAHDPHLATYPYMMEACSNVFQDGVNSCWVDYLEGMHDWVWWQLDLYNSLKVFFQVDEAGENPTLDSLAAEGVLH